MARGLSSGIKYISPLLNGSLRINGDTGWMECGIIRVRRPP